ncbi:MAG: ATP-binding protein [Pseudomonadota bacterium]
MCATKGLSLQVLINEGEGQKIEFKESASALASDMVAFANANGGHIFIGITDNGHLSPATLTKRLRSQIIDMARNCDPPIKVKVLSDPSHIIIIDVPEGPDKPYRCKEGFFLRIGPNSQKLTRDEVVSLIHHAGKIRFDELVNEDFVFPRDFDPNAWNNFKGLAGYPSTMKAEDVLVNIGVASHQEQKLLLTNAAILFFARDPQFFHPEAKITCVKYRGESRYDITDQRDFRGTILTQLDDAMAFFNRYNARQIKITGAPRHEEWEDYPTVAVREAVINALVHRDYFYDSSHIYMHIYDNHMEIDNPGGLIRGLTLEELGSKAARRNRMLADLMQRAGFIENAGTGIMRMRKALSDNNNPSPDISATNFFSVKFLIRPKGLTGEQLTDRQKTLYAFISQRRIVSKRECQEVIGVGADTTLSELAVLMEKGLIKKTGRGRVTRYVLV